MNLQDATNEALKNGKSAKRVINGASYEPTEQDSTKYSFKDGKTIKELKTDQSTEGRPVWKLTYEDITSNDWEVI